MFPRFLSESENLRHVVIGDKFIRKIQHAVIEVPAQAFVRRGHEQRGFSRFVFAQEGVFFHRVFRGDGGENVPQFPKIAVAVFALVARAVELGRGDHLHRPRDLYRVLDAPDMPLQLVRVHNVPPPERDL